MLFQDIFFFYFKALKTFNAFEWSLILHSEVDFLCSFDELLFVVLTKIKLLPVSLKIKNCLLNLRLTFTWFRLLKKNYNYKIFIDLPVSEKRWICKRNRWWKFKSQLARIQTQGLLQSVPAPNHWATKTWYCWFLIKCTKLISRQTPLIDSKILHFFSLKLHTKCNQYKSSALYVLMI